MKTITLQTSKGEVTATITTVNKGWMVASFEMNGKVITGNVDTRKRTLVISESLSAKIKESSKELQSMYDSCFEIKWDEPFLEVNHDGEQMIKKGTKTNIYTGEVDNIEKTLWSN